MYGKTITTVDQTTTRIDVSGLAAGMYFVRVTTDRGVVTKPFVKK
ncbi:MAG: T9SS type A sorting domain-containing protein [Bacteroidales bacterium]|nr:T9SS type A sorting domain-containing protein [Bacteroidales bacterium]